MACCVSTRDWVAEQTDYHGKIAESALAQTVSNKVEAAYRRTDFLDKRRLLMRDWAEFCKNTSASSNKALKGRLRHPQL